MQRPFDHLNPGPPATPVVISVPHAGRDYARFAHRLRAAPAQLRLLEDRFADRLADAAAAAGVPVLVARTPRAWIDLNRAEGDLDPGMIAHRAAAPLSRRAAVGLGLIPRRLYGVGELWRAPILPGDLAERIAHVHRPWHAALAAALNAARARFGRAVLVDLHSMPSLAGANAPDIVIGDDWGRAARMQLSARAADFFARHGYRTAVNAPYAGGHTVQRHGRPGEGIEAVQLEIDRALYLDPLTDAPHDGLPRLQSLIAELAESLAAPDLAVAAE